MSGFRFSTDITLDELIANKIVDFSVGLAENNNAQIANSSTLSVGSTTSQVLFNTVNYDTSVANAITGTTANALTVQHAGNYLITFSTSSANAAGSALAFINKNSLTATTNVLFGSNQQTMAGGASGFLNASAIVPLAAGDVVRAFIQVAGGTIVFGALQPQTLSIQYMVKNNL